MQDVLRQCLTDLDVNLARRAWCAAFPHLPPLGGDDDVLVILHYARTQALSSPLRDRAYSHRWLTDRCYPSGLPDNLRPRAERIFPAAVGVVGIATKTRSALATEVRLAMEYVVNDCYADGEKNPNIIKPRMLAARDRVLRQI